MTILCRESHGHAMIVNPWGHVVADVGGEKIGVSVAEIDLDYLEEVRKRMPVAAHRRPDVYAREPRVAEKGKL